MSKYVTGNLKQPDAGPTDGISAQHEVGASEAEDMQAIEQIEQARRHKSAQLEQLGRTVQKSAR